MKIDNKETREKKLKELCKIYTRLFKREIDREEALNIIVQHAYQRQTE